MSIRILVADDHEVVRSGVSNLMSGTEIEVVSEAGGGEEALEKAEQQQPDVVVLDIRMPGGDGLTTLERFKTNLPKLPVLILSTYDNPTYVARAMALGASGYVLKGSGRDDLLSAIRQVASGQDAWTTHEYRRVAGTPTPTNGEHQPPTPQTDAALTQRETQVLKQLALGLSNKEIARALHISVETVKEHVHHILEKLGVAGRTQAAVWAVRHGVI